MKYIVVECHRSYAVLLDEEGRFFNAANLHYEVGQVITNPVLMISDPQNRAKRMIRIGRLITILTICLLLFFGIGIYRNYFAAYSSIYMAINPEIRIDLNRRGNVIDLEDLNDDGDELLEDYSWKGKDKSEIANELIIRAAKMGYLDSNGHITFLIDAPDKSLHHQYKTELRENLHTFLKDNPSITIDIAENYHDFENFEDDENDEDDEDDLDDLFDD